MKVLIKKFDVGMEVKQNGIEFEVRSPDGKNHIGDLYLTKTRLVWCIGKITLGNGEKIRWQDFMDLVKSKKNSNLTWKKVIKLIEANKK